MADINQNTLTVGDAILPLWCRIFRAENKYNLIALRVKGNNAAVGASSRLINLAHFASIYIYHLDTGAVKLPTHRVRSGVVYNPLPIWRPDVAVREDATAGSFCNLNLIRASG